MIIVETIFFLPNNCVVTGSLAHRAAICEAYMMAEKGDVAAISIVVYVTGKSKETAKNT